MVSIFVQLGKDERVCQQVQMAANSAQLWDNIKKKANPIAQNAGYGNNWKYCWVDPQDG